MATAQENFDTAFKQTNDRVEMEVATRLKTYWPQLGAALGLPKPADDETYLRYARGLIDKGEFTAIKADGSETSITITTLDQKIGEAAPSMLENMGIRSLRDIIPTRQQVNSIAVEMGEAAKENTGTIGFLGGATFSAALRGFFQWIGNVFSWMFSGEKGSPMPGLFETIAQTAAGDMRNSSTARLQKLRETDPAMGGLLTDQRISEIGQGSYDAVLSTAGYAPANAAPAPSLASVAPEELRRKDIGEMVYREVKPKTEQAILDNIRGELAKKSEQGEAEKRKNEENSFNIPIIGAITPPTSLQAIGFTGGQYVLDHFGTPDAIRNMSNAQLREKLTSFNRPGDGVPTASDVDAVSSLVAKAVQKVSTQKDYTFNGKRAEQMTAEEFGAAVQQEVTAILTAERQAGRLAFLGQETTSLIPTIATKAAEEAQQNHETGKFSFTAYLEGATPPQPVVQTPATPAAAPNTGARPIPATDDKGIPVAQNTSSVER